MKKRDCARSLFFCCSVQREDCFLPLRGGKNCLSRLPVDGHVRPPAAVDRGKACVRQIGKFRGVLSQQGSVGEFSGPCSPILCRNAEVIPAAAHVPRGVEIIPLPINGSHQPHVKARRSIPYHGGAVQSRLGVQKGQRLREGIADAAVQHQCRIELLVRKQYAAGSSS